MHIFSPGMTFSLFISFLKFLFEPKYRKFFVLHAKMMHRARDNQQGSTLATFNRLIHISSILVRIIIKYKIECELRVD